MNNEKTTPLEAAMLLRDEVESLTEMLNTTPNYFGDRVLDVRDATNALLSFYSSNMKKEKVHA